MGEAIAKKNSYHLVVLTSTVMPGATGTACFPRSRGDPESGAAWTSDCATARSSSRSAASSATSCTPTFCLIGESDERSGDALDEVYRRIVKDPVVARLNFENAELAKISVNTYVTTKIAFANMLAASVSACRAASVDVVTLRSARTAASVAKYLRGAISYGGPCFPRDNVAFGFLCEHVGADGDLLVANHGYNQSIAARFTTKIAPLLQTGRPPPSWACRTSLSPTSSRSPRVSPSRSPWRKRACG